MRKWARWVFGGALILIGLIVDLDQLPKAISDLALAVSRVKIQIPAEVTRLFLVALIWITAALVLSSPIALGLERAYVRMVKSRATARQRKKQEQDDRDFLRVRLNDRRFREMVEGLSAEPLELLDKEAFPLIEAGLVELVRRTSHDFIGWYGVYRPVPERMRLVREILKGR